MTRETLVDTRRRFVDRGSEAQLVRLELDRWTARVAKLEAENTALRSQVAELTRRVPRSEAEATALEDASLSRFKAMFLGYR